MKRPKTMVFRSDPPVAVMPAGTPGRVIIVVRGQDGWIVVGSVGNDGVFKPTPDDFPGLMAPIVKELDYRLAKTD